MDQACTKPINDSPQSVAVSYVVTPGPPPPTLSSISPTTTTAGSAAFTLTANGTNFTTQTVLQWNGTALQTNYVSANQLTAQVSAANVATAGSYPVTASQPGSALSNAIKFTVTPLVLSLTAISPTTVTVGSPALMLTVLGQDFGCTSVVFDAESGKVLGNFSDSYLPAFTATTGFFLTNSTLQGIARSNNQILCSFTGDGTLVTTPIVINNYVFVGSSQGNLYALDGTTGAQVWTQNLGAAMQANAENQLLMYTGLAAGDGLLVVPAGNTVTAYTLSNNP